MALTTIPVELVTLDDGVTITVDDNSAALTIKSTDADSSNGPIFDLVRDSSSPADNDALGMFRFKADNDAGEETILANIRSIALDVSDGSEDGRLIFNTMINGNSKNRLDITNEAVIINEASADSDFRVESNGLSHALFVDGGNDKVIINHTTTVSQAGVAPQFQVHGTGSATSSISATRNSNDSGGPYLILSKSRGTSTGAVTVVQDSDILGQIMFAGADGGDLAPVGASIQAFVDGTPGTNDMPGRLVFSTTADGAAAATQRMILQSDGGLRIGGSSFGNITGGMNYVTLADDATKTIALAGTATAGGALLVVYDGASGDTCLFHVGYGHASIVSQSVSNFATSDTDNKYCVIVSGHNISFKNRLGSSKNLNIMVYGAGNWNYNL